MKKYILTVSFCFLSLCTGAFTNAFAAAEPVTVTAVVYKSPTCGCCSKWEKHLEDNGFKVESHPTTDMMAVKSKYHIPTGARSCHTAIIGGYVVEGHVPAEDIKKLIKQHPAGVVGISVPGMPTGSPGMEGEDGQADSYDVVTFDSKGKTTVFSHH